MTINTLEYPLVNGYIHNWIVAGPQAVEVKDLQRFTGPDWKMQVARHYYQAEVGLEDTPVEYTKVKVGDFEGEWNYVRTKVDHFVDLSAFYHLTHYLQAWAYTEIASPAAQEISFTLTTNGPADLWINDQHVHRQEHFYHQIPKRVKFTARLAEGTNRLMVRMEEVAARECPFSMALHLGGFETGEGEEEKVVRIPTNAPDLLQRMRLELIFEASHLRQDVYGRQDAVTLYLPKGPALMNEFNIRLQNLQSEIYADAFHKDYMADPSLKLAQTYQIPEGNYQIMMLPDPQRYYQTGLRIIRKYDLYATSHKYSTQPYGTYAERRNEALLDAARRKDNVFSEIAKMELGYWKDVELDVVLKAIEGINQRRDCSDFYLCGLLGMFYHYGENPNFPAELKEPLKSCILNFKYWDDEPGSDAMCYRTENHSILFHTCEVLAGQLYPGENFTNVSQPGRWHVEAGQRRALDWLENRAATGFKEWDSNTYFEEDVLALSTLAGLAEDAQVWEMAAVVLDKMFFTLAVNSFKGVFGSTHGRTYTPYIKSGYREGTAGISRLLWGMGIFNERIMGTVSLACSNYELPPVIEAIATDLPEEMWNREQHTGDEQDFSNSGSRGTGVNKVTYKTPDYMMCSAQDWHAGEKGYQQHIWQVTLSPTATVFTTHPPCAAEDGSHRPNFWHGNETLPRVAQWKDVLVAVYNFPADDWMGFTHAYFPGYAFEDFDLRDGWAFAQVGAGYLALTAARGLEFITQGDSAHRELRSHGTPNIWLCHMGRQALDGTFEQFIQKVLEMEVDFDLGASKKSPAQVELTSLRGEQLRFGWKGALKVNGKTRRISGFKHYDNPYCSARLGAETMEIQYGADLLRLNFGRQETENKD